MLTQQDIYAAGSESRPPMLNKENYVPWPSRLLRIQEKKAKLFNEWERFTSNEGESIESYYHQCRESGCSESKSLECWKSEWANWCSRNGNQNQIGNGNLVVVRAEGNAAGHNENQIRCYNCRGVGHFARDWTVRPRRRGAAYL
nr:Gag-Pol polyprotein [Tanacetum cinerariifolium]